MTKRFTLKVDDEIIAAFDSGNRLRMAIDMAFRESGVYGYNGDINDDFLIGFVIARTHEMRNIYGGSNTITLDISS